jgi:hypothetical protein
MNLASQVVVDLAEGKGPNPHLDWRRVAERREMGQETTGPSKALREWYGHRFSVAPGWSRLRDVAR